MKIIDEFKTFAVKGNVIDLAVGVIIGGAFGKIVTSLVSDLVMPILSILVAGVNFAELDYVLKEAGPNQDAVILKYGSFLQATLDFLIIAFAIFMAIKVINRLRFREELKVVEPAPMSDEVKLLAEIRDELRNRSA